MTNHRLLAFLISLTVLFGAIVSGIVPAVAQDQGGPPTIEPSNGAQGQEQGQGQGNGGILETNFELGNGGQPEDFPREVTVDGARFLFDRMVPATRQDLIPVAQDGPIQAFATIGHRAVRCHLSLRASPQRDRAGPLPGGADRRSRHLLPG